MIQLGAGGALASYSTATATADTELIHNAYRHSGNNWKYRYQDTACKLLMNTPGGAFIFQSAASGNADADITFSEKLRIASDGDLTLTGADNVEIKMKCGTSSGNNILAFLNSGGTTRGNITYDSDNNFLLFNVNQGERARIDSNGNVNFGANKTVALPSGTGIQVYNSSAPRIKLVNDTTGNAAGDGLQIYVTGSSAIFDQKEDADMRFYTDATERLRILADGEVLIGGRNNWGGGNLHPNTVNKLVITGPSPANVYNNILYLEGSETNGNANTGGALSFGGHDGSQYRNWGNIYGMKENGTGGNRAAYMSFHTRPDGGDPTERLRLTSAGLVKILGDGQNDGFYLSNAYGQAAIFGGMYYNGSAWVRAAVGTRKPAGMYVNTGGHIAFLTASETSGTSATPSEKVRITNDGEIRIGANSTAANTAGDDLVIEGSSDRGLSIISGTGSSANIYFGDSGDADIGRIAYQHNDNALDFSVNAGSTALRIDSQGKLGIKQTNPSAYLDISQGGIDSNVPGINIGMTGVGGGTAGEQYGIKITGGGYNNATHIYGLYINKSAQLTQNNTAAYCRMQGVYSTLTGVRGIAKCQDTAASGTIYAGYFTAQGDIGSAKTKVGYGIWAESTGTKFQLSNAARLKTMSGATLVYGIIYQHGSSEVFRVSSNGDVWSATNSYTSDRDLKDNIVNLSGTSLDKIKQLTPKRFNWKLDDRVKDIEDYDDITVPTNTVTGLIAQEVKPILPDIVSGTDGEKDMGINYNGLVAHLVNAVKELSVENEAMRARLDALESS